MPADLDELFTALGTHADRVPLAEPEGARRHGERRRRRHGTAGLALVLVAAVAAIGVTQLADRPTPPAGPDPAAPFIPLRPAGFAPSSGDLRMFGTVPGVDGLTYVVRSTTDGQLELSLHRFGDATVVTQIPLADQAMVSEVTRRPDGTLGVLTELPGQGRWRFGVFNGSGMARWNEVDAEHTFATGVAVLVTSSETGLATALDWRTGEVIWRRALDTTQGLTHVYPAAPAPPLAVGGWGVDPAEHRLVAVGGDGTVEVIDSRTGYTQRAFTMERPEAVVAFGEFLYASIDDVVWAYPLDRAGEPTMVYVGSVRVRPCGAGLLCLAPGDGPTLLIDSATQRQVGTAPIGRAVTVVGERVVTDDGAVFDLSGNVVAAAPGVGWSWWVAPDRVLTLTKDTGNAGTVVVGELSTVDGAWTELGRIPDVPCVATLHYLVCDTPEGVQAWQFATG